MKMTLGRKFALALPLALLFGGVLAADTGEKAVKVVASFGSLESPKPEVAKQQALDWLKSVGKTDAASIKSFEAIWSTDRPLLHKVTKTLVLGDEKAAKLMADVSDAGNPAPTEVPEILQDLKVPSFYRANLALAYARQLSNRRIYDEALLALRGVKPEQVVDPGAYFFTRAVAEYTLMMKTEADGSILRLLDDVADAPERYRMVAALMHFDMMTWQEKDLGWISRKMNVIKDRLEIARGGKKTQRMQKEVLVRLDEMIKEMENQQKQQGGTWSNGGGWPSGGQQPGGPPSGNQPSGPATESGLPSGQSAGKVDPKRLKEVADVWGTLPEKERAKALLELTRDMPANYREAIEIYLKGISSGN